MSVFNDLSGLEAVAEHNGFELILDEKDKTNARYGLRAKNSRAIQKAYGFLKLAQEYDPSWLALNTDLQPFAEEDLRGYIDNNNMFHTIECSYYPTDRDMDVVFYDFNGHYIGGEDGHYNNWSIYDANSLDDGIEKITRHEYADVTPIWETQMQEFNQQAQDTILLAERYKEYRAKQENNPMSGEVIATGLYPSKYVGQFDIGVGQ